MIYWDFAVPLSAASSAVSLDGTKAGQVGVAGRLLLQTDKTIEGIADASGFPNHAYFSRIFKKVTSESPARFRQKHGQVP